MIVGIGTDIVRVARMQSNIERYGERFAQRILTSAEMDDYRREGRKAHFLAKRFAAKEAAAKALGTGFSGGLGYRDIGVSHDPTGQPALEFSGTAAQFIHSRGINSAHISLADEDDYAVAFVTLARD